MTTCSRFLICALATTAGGCGDGGTSLGTADLAALPDLVTADLAAAPDLGTADLAALPDLVTADLAKAPDLATADVAAAPDLAAADLAAADLAAAPDLGASDLASRSDGGAIACGYVTIATQADLNAALSCTSMTTLAIAMNNVVPIVSLPMLASVGDVYLQKTTGIARLDLTALQTVSGNFSVSHDVNLQTINAPQVTSIGKFLYFDHNTALRDVHFGSLTKIGGYLYADSNLMLQSLDLGSLVTVDYYIYVTNNTALAQVSIGALAHVNNISGSNSPIYIANNSAWCAPSAQFWAAKLAGMAPMPYLKGNLCP